MNGTPYRSRRFASASAAAAAVHAVLAAAGAGRAGLLAAAAVCTLLSIALGQWAQAFYGSPDPKPFVLDEAAGYFLCAGLVGPTRLAYAVAAVFLWFRLFDVAKPFPLRRLERLPHGIGIVADDLAAAVYAAVAAWITLKLLGAS